MDQVCELLIFSRTSYFSKQSVESVLCFTDLVEKDCSRERDKSDRENYINMMRVKKRAEL